jgi:hypothetical protein
MNVEDSAIIDTPLQLWSKNKPKITYKRLKFLCSEPKDYFRVLAARAAIRIMRHKLGVFENCSTNFNCRSPIFMNLNA